MSGIATGSRAGLARVLDGFGARFVRWRRSPRFERSGSFDPIVVRWLATCCWEHATDRRESMTVLEEPIEAGEVTPVISAHYPLSVVPEATRHFEEGHARGKVVIIVAPAD